MSARQKSALPTKRVGKASLYTEARQEALRHKWIESQKLGRDLGQYAIEDWYQRFWPTYCRCKRVEHLEGCRLWQEFGDDDFGHLYGLIVRGDLLADRILDRFYEGFENLDLINWAMDWGLPVDQVIAILVQLDMNRARLDP